MLMQAVYLGGVFLAIKQGLPAGMVSLLVGLQPLLTALLAIVVLGEVVRRRQWFGLVLGIAGTAMVLSGRIEGGFSLTGVLPALCALLGITLGALYQKRFCPHFDWRTGAVIQFLAAALVTLPIAAHFEGFHIEFTGQFIFALSWLVLVLSLGAISLLNYLIRHGSAVNVASLFYLTPPVTALIAWVLFDETLTLIGCEGLVIAVIGVALVRKA
jgi:drug/metabolite transporter (DMT)-like permease